jgi:cellulose synthase/poly-beta-1,6-N-acetylglucosamine synthase-like glycosyltransferase
MAPVLWVASGILTVLVALVLGYGLTYFLWLQLAGLLRGRAERRAGAPPAPAQPLAFYFLVPCLNEEAVIGETVRNLASQDPEARIVVVDDGSDDTTAAVARAADPERALVVERRPPEARLGKGAALNDAIGHVEADASRRGLEPDQVVVCVMDADGRLSPGTLAAVAPLFDDPRTGGAQLQVRIRNRDRLLTRVQDMGFWGNAAVAQLGRDLFGSVSLGGNGQFARLSALRSLPGEPWSRSLTEDLDLTISLAVRGWRTRMTANAHVHQEGPEDLHALVRQRTRWAQGHMVCAARCGELWRSRQLSHGAALELTLYLLQPWCLTLTWSLLAPLLLVGAVVAVVAVAASDGALAALGGVLAAYVLALFPYLWGTVVYARRAEDCGHLRAFALNHVSYLATCVSYVATWRALRRIRSGSAGWDKTARTGDEPSAPSSAQQLTARRR